MEDATNTSDFLHEIRHGDTCALNPKVTFNNFTVVITVVDNCNERRASKNMLIINARKQIIQDDRSL